MNMYAQPIHNQNLTDLNIAQHNVQSINRNKLQVINHLEKYNIHVYVASEIWNRPTDNFFLKNYTCLERCRADGYAGVALCFKNNITFDEVELPELVYVNAIAAATNNLNLNVTFVSVYVPAKKKDLPEGALRRDLLILLRAVKNMKNVIIGGDFNAFHNAWGSYYNDVRGILLMDELESFCLLNDGSPTRVPTRPGTPNPLDLTWATSNIFERLEWSVKKESLGSDHLVVFIQLSMAMNSEAIKVKAKIDYEAFRNNVEELDIQDVDNMSDFILAIEGAKEEATTRQKTLRNPKFFA